MKATLRPSGETTGISGVIPGAPQPRSAASADPGRTSRDGMMAAASARSGRDDGGPRPQPSDGGRERSFLVWFVEQETGIGDRVQPAAGILLQAAAEQSALALGHAIPVGIFLDDGGQRVGRRSSRERPASGEHLVQHDPERPDVGPMVERLTSRLLGAHIRRRTENDARPRCARGCQSSSQSDVSGRRCLECLRQSEVEDLDRACRRDLDVGRLEIAVDDAVLVSCLEGTGDLVGN